MNTHAANDGLIAKGLSSLRLRSNVQEKHLTERREIEEEGQEAEPKRQKTEDRRQRRKSKKHLIREGK